jgi:hypothetical protein
MKVMSFPSPRKFNLFTLFQLPSVWLTGVRVKAISEQSCSVTVKHRWINQNPFKSLFWAVQGMAAELATGALVIAHIKQNNQKMAMLVVQNRATFTKKATGRIHFVCHDGQKIKETIAAAIADGQGHSCWMKAVGTNADGVVVSTFEFEWSIKLRQKTA